ncbi:hypothetical protein K458DRAFT_486793 [Lentithecium fluviatile CBS 122367]|uniref:DUF6594 domain-containing protein n=1 Tax=Lentithecium fluviatile CBS 122367 TaxID=1168545 RepID=A0A6G1J410_9PLEO|nr:hypothetical protein K458DRAFT_486793 [Lentithecium fluviatile CBS 122367]
MMAAGLPVRRSSERIPTPPVQQGDAAAATANLRPGNQDRNNKMSGYPRLAIYQSKYQEYAIFRKFSKLNMLNLLYLQAEIKHLEAEMEITMEDDFNCSDAPRKNYHSNWRELSGSCRNEHEDVTPANQQYRTYLRLKEVLKEYNEALIQNSQVSALSSPSQDHRAEFGHIIRRPDYCNQVVANTAGVETDTWTDLENGDFVTLYPQPIDAFTKRILHKLIHYYHKVIGRNEREPDPETGIWVYPDSAIANAGDVVTIILSALIPVSAIISLYYTPSMIGRILVSFGYALLFAGLLWSLTVVKRGEIFALSTALFAIEVVFIGSTVFPNATP